MMQRLLLLLGVLVMWGQPVFAQTLLTDFNVRPEPALPTMGAKGSKIVDPTFGTTILRVTDATDGSYGRTPYSSYPSVNANSTRVLGRVGGSNLTFWTLNASAFTVANKESNPAGLPNLEGYFARWSGTNPDVIYGGGGGARIWSYNIATHTGSSVKDFSAYFTANGCSGCQTSQIQQSKDDNIFSGNILSGSTAVGYFLWKRDTDTMLKYTLTSTNETYVDKTGQYFWVTLGGGCTTQIYTTANPPVLLGTQTFCHNGPGTSSIFSYGSNGATIRTLPSVTPTVLMSGYFTLGQQSQHHSFNANDESYGLICRHTDGTRSNLAVQAAFDKEIVLVSTSGNAVKRIAHHRSVTGTGYGYYDTPFANISPDGQFVAFTSNWGGTAGNNRQDLYLVKVPVGAAPDTTPPTIPTATAAANGAGQITVSWTAANDASGVTGYNVRRCTGAACTPTTIVSTVSGSTLSFVNTGLTSSTVYRYSVNAFDAAGNQGTYSAVTEATTTATFKTISGYDLFDVANGADIGASWTAGYTSLQPFKIVSQRVLPSLLSTSSVESYTGIASSADQWAQVTLSIYNATTSVAGVLVRLQASPTFTAYECRVTNGTTSDIVEWAAGVGIGTLATATTTWLEGDKIRCEAEGTALRFYRIRNGAETLITSATDGTLATGYTGLKQFETTDLTDVQFDDFVTGGFSGTAPTEAAITSVSASTTDATVVYTGTPVWIRVETATVSVVEPLSAFPGGVYTYPSTIAASLTTSICFYPRNALGVENVAGSVCDTTVTVTDTTAPVITNTTPATWPVDTTSATLSVTTNEPAFCRYSTDNFADSANTVEMTPASLTHSATISGLANNTSYTYYVKCMDTSASQNDSLTSTVINTAVDAATADVTAPSTVTNLVATALSSTQAELVWTAATDAGGIAGYQVYLCSYVGEVCTEYELAGQPVPSTTFVVALQPSTNYAFVVRAIDTSSNLSAANSNVATITTSGLIDHEAPSTMANLTAIAYSASVKLTWNAGTDNSGLVFSIIEQCTGAACSDFVVVKTDIAGTQLIRSLSSGTVYCFRGKHSDISGNVSTAYSETVCATTKTSGLGQPRAVAGARSSAAVTRAARTP